MAALDAPRASHTVATACSAVYIASVVDDTAKRRDTVLAVDGTPCAAGLTLTTTVTGTFQLVASKDSEAGDMTSKLGASDAADTRTGGTGCEPSVTFTVMAVVPPC